MARITAVVFDFVGTLVEVENYDYDASVSTLYRSLLQAGFKVGEDCFVEAYRQAHEKCRQIRHQRLVEITNAVWIAEALSGLGCETSAEDGRVKTAVNIFFKDYVDSIKPRLHAKSLLKRLAGNYSLGLVSNFTYAPVVYAAMRKVGYCRFFNAVLVSEAFGWRKPSQKVFSAILGKLNVDAGHAVFVGDSPEEDIGGAQKAGLKTVFIPSQFYGLSALVSSRRKPDAVINGLSELPEVLLRLAQE